MVREDDNTAHPSDAELAAYLGRELLGEELERIERHLAQCARCREEVIDAEEILRPPRHLRWKVVVPVAAAAAVAVLFFPWVGGDRPSPPEQPVHREAPGAVVSTPSPISPVGEVERVEAFGWELVSGADRYRVTLFDAGGSVLWRATSVDSLIALPDSVALESGQPYLWRVEARVGWDVWESSDMTQFQLRGGGIPPSFPQAPE